MTKAELRRLMAKRQKKVKGGRVNTTYTRGTNRFPAPKKTPPTSNKEA